MGEGRGYESRRNPSSFAIFHSSSNIGPLLQSILQQLKTDIFTHNLQNLVSISSFSIS